MLSLKKLRQQDYYSMAFVAKQENMTKKYNKLKKNLDDYCNW